MVISFNFYTVINPFGAETDFIRQIPTSKVGSFTERVKYL